MKQPGGKRHRRLVFYIFLCASLWASGIFVNAAGPGELLISRVQITGGTGKTDNDFITIYNNTQNVLDLNGIRLVKRTANGTTDTTIKSWVDPTLLNPSAYYTWANSNNSFSDLMRADTSSTQTISADNGIALRQGTENTGTILDSLAWGVVFNAFIEGLPFATNPLANQTLERTNNLDTNNNAIDFHLIPTVFPGTCGNHFLENNEQCDDGNLINGDGCSSVCLTETVVPVCGNSTLETGESCDDDNSASGDGCSVLCQLEITSENTEIYINEFVADPVTGSNEWIELYTVSTAPINLTNWSIEDGAGTKTRLSGTIGGSNLFLVVEKPSGALNNAGDAIIVRNQNGEIVDQVAYGNWDDGNLNDNTPAASDPYSVARNQNGLSTDNDSLDFSITTTVTKNTSNVITPPITIEEDEQETNAAVKVSVVISEVYPNPTGIDATSTAAEFIELYNQGEQTVQLEGWHLEIGNKEYIYTFSNLSIAGKSYLVIPALNNYKLSNSGSSVKLFQVGKATASQTVTYKEAPEGASWMLLDETNNAAKTWQWTKKPTPQAKNTIVLGTKAAFSVMGDLLINELLTFDSSDSETGNILTTYNWNFGDGKSSREPYPQHTYSKTGSYTVTLTVKNNNGTSTLAKKIKITAPPETEVDLTIAQINEGESKIISLATGNSALHLNEILPNPSGKDEGLEWLEISNTGNVPVSLVGWRIATKSKKGPLITIDLTIEAQGLLVLPKEFTPTLGNSNETIQLLAADGTVVDSITYDTAPENRSYAAIDNHWEWTTQLTPADDNVIKDESGTVKSTAKKTVDAKTAVTGMVATLPGTFSTQYFYLKPDNSEILLQIYNSKKLFPNLKLNQTVSINGEQSTIASGPRLKTAEASDITITGEGVAPELTVSNSSTLKQGSYPRLIKIEGEVTSKKSPRLIVTDAQGDNEVYLAKGSSLTVSRFNLGDKLTVTGILELSGTAPRVMPRSENDIVFLNAAPGPESSTTADKVSEALTSQPRDNEKQTLTYLILGAVLLLGAGGYGIWKYWHKGE